jgi:predicted phage tail protein
MMTTVHLHGHLREAFGAEFRFDVETVGEIFAALHCNRPGFRQ